MSPKMGLDAEGLTTAFYMTAIVRTLSFSIRTTYRVERANPLARKPAIMQESDRLATC